METLVSHTALQAVIKLIYRRKLQILRKSVIQTHDNNFAKEQILRKKWFNCDPPVGQEHCSEAGMTDDVFVRELVAWGAVWHYLPTIWTINKEWDKTHKRQATAEIITFKVGCIQ